MIPYLKLVGGVISIIISLVWVVQLFGSTIYVNGSPGFKLLD